MLHEKLAARKLPSLMKMNCGKDVRTPDDWRVRRRELLEILQREEYGFTPSAPKKVIGTIENSERAFAGKAIQSLIRISFDTPNGTFAFPFTLIMPEKSAKAPMFLCINFRPDIPDRYIPVEEIIDHGFGLAIVYYNDITADGPELDGLAAMYPIDASTGWGKIGMWAFACSRILDYLETRSDVDAARVCVSGHSRLGKTALWCAAQDERFAMAVSNDSGCSGAAISRGKIGESIEVIANRFPYWFCGNYQNWKQCEYESDFDQHMLLALVAPRKLYVASATEDDWADPESEFLCCLAADEAWKLLRVPGLITPNEMPTADAPLIEGGICYHLRTGMHFFSRSDWMHQIAAREHAHI